ncbi:hypothetical protein [Hydrocarboniclastica marina]|nr:hypothetical protein [Hydrocarboniclastica marina]
MNSTYVTGLRQILLSGCILAASTQVIAAPTIDSVGASIVGSGMLVVKGSGFSTASGQLALLDEVDSHNIARDSSTPLEASASDVWMGHGSPWASGLTAIPLDGTPEAVYYGKGKTFSKYIHALDGLNNSTLYAAWDYMPTESPGHSGGSNKFIRIWDNHDGEETRLSWTQMHMTYTGGGPSWEGWPGSTNKWNRMEIWVDGDAGVVQASVNGKLVHDIKDFKKISDTIGLNVALLGFDPNSGSKYSTMETHIDNLYVSTSRSRAVLSQEASWEKAKAGGHIQLVSDWSPSQLTIQLNKSGLERLKGPAYLYIVNDAGEVNPDGFEVCQVCPNPPTLTMQ